MDEKERCRICDQSAPAKYRRLLFAEADRHGALVARFNRLVANMPFSIADDECLSTFACRTCVTKLEQMDTHKQKADNLQKSLT